MIFCARTQEGEKLVVPRTERHACLLEVRTCMYVCLRQLWIFIIRVNASLARLITSHAQCEQGGGGM